MNLKDVDLNLLVVFNELHKHGRVSAAAESLGISQPGVSNALGRLRKLLGDELFLRTSRGMVPTPYAQDLAQPIAAALEALHSTLNARAAFDPAHSGRAFVIGVNDVGETYFLPRLMRAIARQEQLRFIVFCDDLSFDKDESSYKSLKTILDGGLEGRPANTLFYATSNRRHLMPRDMIDNERATAINPGEAIEEKVSLSDRFGLWLGFHNCDQDTYLAMVRNYVTHYGIEVDDDELQAKAIEWSATRGSRSGRVAIQFVRHLAGEKGKAIG